MLTSRCTTSRGGEELPGLLPGLVGEVLQQVLIRLPEQVVADVIGVQRDAVEGVEQVDQRGLRQALLIAPCGVPEDPGEGLGVRLLDLGEGFADTHPDVVGLGGHRRPVRLRRHGEAVKVALDLVVEVVAVICDRSGVLPRPVVADPFPEQHREDVRFEVGGVDRSAQRVRGGPQACFEVGQAHPDLSHPVACLLHTHCVVPLSPVVRSFVHRETEPSAVRDFVPRIPL